MSVRPSVEQLRQLGMWSQAHRWIVEVQKMPITVTSVSSEDINFRAESMALPGLNAPSIEVNIRGNVVNQHGRGTYEAVTLNLVETMDHKCGMFISEWEDSCWLKGNGSIGTQENKLDAEATIKLTLLNNKDKPSWWYLLIGCLMDNATKGEAGNEADPYRPNLSLKYDYFKEGPM